MKKISKILFLIIVLINISGCAGYKPIFNSTNIKFTIGDYSIKGDKKIGNEIYYQLLNASKLNAKSVDSKNIYILINASKNKSVTSKDKDDKILGYKISLTCKIEVKNLETGNQILNENFTYSSTYETQNQYSETLKLENKSLENLINKTYEDLLIKLSDKLS